jgi:hypothetical protein
MAVTASVFAAWLKNRRILFGILLALSPWCRPEGMMLIAAFGFVFVCSFVRLFVCSSARQPGTSHENHSSLVTRHSSLVHGDFIAVCIAALSAVGVFVFNYCLTGQFQFHSVEFKGYFGNLPFADAVWTTISDFLTMLRQLVLGQPADNAVRTTFSIPFLGALFAWIGLISFTWRRRPLHFAGWLLASLLSLLSVASGGFQGTNFDRYLAWLLPTGLIFTSYGIIKMADWSIGKAPWEILATAVITFQCFGAFASLSWFGSASRKTQLDYETFASMKEALALSDGDIGGTGSVGGGYLLGNKRIFHIPGYYTPAFRSRDITCNIEVIKHEPENRFDYWLSNSSKPMLVSWDAKSLAGEQVFQGLNRYSLWKADWTLLDAALNPVATNTPIAELALADRVDVGYLRDEKRTGFKVNYRLPGLSYLAFAMDGECDGTHLVDVGRPVIGWADMRVRLRPNVDAIVILRTASKAKGVRQDLYSSAENMSLKPDMRIHVFIDGQQVSSEQLKLNDDDGIFTEVAFRIHGKAIRNETSRVQIFGDHLAFGYWFYQ